MVRIRAPGDRRLLEMRAILKELKVAYGMNPEQVKAALGEGPVVPITLYTDREVGIMELTVKYLRENSGFSLSYIARIMGRDPRTVWALYSTATKKRPEALAPELTEFLIPVSVFMDRDKGALQAIVTYLKDRQGLRFSEIGRLMNRDPRIVCTVYHKK